MIRNRHFMTGIGIGLILGALLLQVMLIGQGQTGKLQTREQIEQAAAFLDLKVIDNDQELLTEEEWEAQKSEEHGDGDQSTEPKTPESPDPPAIPSTPDSVNPSEPEASDRPDPAGVHDTTAPTSPQEPSTASVEYKIASGSTLSQVADGLLQAGVISDKEAFLKEAQAKKINYKVRAGTFTFELGEKYDSIISKISPGTAQ